MAKSKRDSHEPAPTRGPTDPNLPRPDGPRVSNRGGLVFVMVIFGLIAAAVLAELLGD